MPGFFKLKKNLKGIKVLILKHDFDWLIVIAGYERVGKSTLALQVCRYIDPKFTEEQVVFDVRHFSKLVWSLEPGRAILIDEGATAMFNRNAMTADVKTGVQILTTMGARNLFVVICVPSFEILDKYIQEHRVRSVLRVTSRGNFLFYSKRQIERSHYHKTLKKRFWAEPNFQDSFKECSGELWEKYKKRKMDYLIERSEHWFEQQTEQGQEKAAIENRLDELIPLSKAAKMLGISGLSLKARLKNGVIAGGKNMIGRWCVPLSEIQRIKAPVAQNNSSVCQTEGVS
jgi:hypothetical protein